jgi:hypothetical protein
MANHILRFLPMHGLITTSLVGGLGVKGPPELLPEGTYLTSCNIFFFGGEGSFSQRAGIPIKSKKKLDETEK